MENTCPSNKILNPKTNRCVLKTGVVGKKILSELQNKKTCLLDQVVNPLTNRCISIYSKKGIELASKNGDCPSFGMVQKTGTCWFNTIINGFFLPDRSFNLILSKYDKLSPKEKKLVKTLDTTSQMCPIELKKLYFFKVFHQFLKDKALRTLNRENHPLHMIEIMDIRSTPNWQDQRQGYHTSHALPKILPIIFNKDEYLILDRDEYGQLNFDSHKNVNIIFIAEKERRGRYYSSLENLKIPSGWALNSVGISIRLIKNQNKKISKHAFLGYICKGKKYIYDSQKLQVEEANFFDKTDIISQKHTQNTTVQDMSYSFICLVKI